MFDVRATLLLAGLLAYAGSQAQVITVEGGLDAFRQNVSDDDELVTMSPALSPAVALSAYLQVSDLRSYYGLYLSAHRGELDVDEFGEDTDVSLTTSAATQDAWAAMAGWRAFVFDLEGDCDCPTWGDENWLQKAFFVELAAGYGRQGLSFDEGDGPAVRRGGLAYLTRVGLAHRLTKSVDAMAAFGLHAHLGPDSGYGSHHAAARVNAGLSYRF